jgi:hypothetical protein
VNRVRIGHHGDLVVRHPSGQPVLAIDHAKEPAFAGIGDDVGPPGVD